ncbi:TPA: conjugal transfer mating pair stabilization protein TraN [Klebsiella michiganensis]|uniref:conjugal transfer mating pair stabilization protein TraN n=1 Tax=Enterobacteriaceae TaxID=543 RepID=UPI0016A4CAC3|nr:MULTISPECIES: conjugal transfer mating pair stabilization protein TraN [Enterobacteriaceae]EFJ8746167.1 conjugal transfer mating pair stabilization protein TraN [Escherichia coli]EKY3945817.1 conjugal transfer mating pair stabilization protein TraN [Enterobacter hormaechei]HCL6052342.1 conjugal transfer mating pair stabilization protein TraN [Raoultella ornithinolytica]HED2155641.1 conjugal transfer mating pair stabilization protein TraN [Klebsiella variicola subsp. variicola]HED2254024.1 c
MKKLFRERWFSIPICTLSIISHLGLISFVPYAIAADSTANATSTNQKAQDAVNFYNTLPGISASGQGTVTYGSGQTVDLNSVYPDQQGSSTSLDSLKSVYGDDSATSKLGSTTGTTLTTENSLRGDAYRTMKNVSTKTSSLKDTDSIFNTHKDFLENQNEYMSLLGDCSKQTILDPKDQVNHIPDYRECTRTVNVSGQYHLYHPYIAGILSHNSGPANIQSCGDGCIELWVGTVGDNYWSGKCKIFEEEMSVNVKNTQAITSVKLVRAKWDDYMQVYVGGTGRDDLVWAGPDGVDVFPPETSGRCERNTSWDKNPNVDITDKFKRSTDNGIVHFKTRTSVSGEGEGYAKIEIRFDTSKVVTNDIWEHPDQGYDNFEKAVEQGYCQNYSVACNDAIIPDSNGCATIDGVLVCQDDFVNTPPFGISPFCRNAVVTANCGQSEGVNNTCQQFENAGCNFIRSACLDGASGDESGCWQASEVWDCGKDVVVPSTGSHEEYQCPGGVQCINGTCLAPTTEESGDFATAAAMLQAATYAQNELACDTTGESNNDASTCQVFKGEAAVCKTAMGGWVDCCNQPVNVSWIQYLQLTYYTLKVTDAVSVQAGMFEQGKGIFDMGSELASNAFDAITKPAMSAFDSLTGNAGSAVAEKVSDMGISSAINEAVGELTKQVAQWTLDTFGSSVTNMLFEAGGSAAGEAAVNSAGEMSASVQLSSTLVSAVSVVGYAYMAYQIANILVNIIWACTEDEFKLAVKKETKLAVFIDSWCQTKVLGQCIEKRSSYCTFNSQIGRIIQEQGRQQLGLNWGNDSKNPDCRGLTLTEFGQIDFNKIDLSEWIGSLYEADLLPTADSVDLESITGQGNVLNIDGTRQNTLERFQSGVDGVDVQGTKETLEEQMRVK